jgi:glyoxalase family protein
VTAISGPARRNVGFYTRTLGLRLVKKTVNFDDPGTYHLYYGDEIGRPGSILTFFPQQFSFWRRGGVSPKGHTGWETAWGGYSEPVESDSTSQWRCSTAF